MSKLGQIVYYRTMSAPQRYYPALVTNDGGPGLDLAIFTQEQVIFRAGVCHGQSNEPGAWRAELDEEAPADLMRVVVVQMPAASAHDETALAAIVSSKLPAIAGSCAVVGIWPDGHHVVAGVLGGLNVVVIQAEGYFPPLDAETLNAEQFARAFLAKYGRQRQAINEEILVEWFRASMAGGEIPRARQ